MSVMLFKLAGARGKFDDVEVMPPDYGCGIAPTARTE